MSLSKQEIINMDLNAICEWFVENLEAGLAERGITIGAK